MLERIRSRFSTRMCQDGTHRSGSEQMGTRGEKYRARTKGHTGWAKHSSENKNEGVSVFTPFTPLMLI
jgi:hypothetical protein